MAERCKENHSLPCVRRPSYSVFHPLRSHANGPKDKTASFPFTCSTSFLHSTILLWSVHAASGRVLLLLWILPENPPLITSKSTQHQLSTVSHGEWIPYQRTPMRLKGQGDGLIARPPTPPAPTPGRSRLRPPLPGPCHALAKASNISYFPG